MPIAGIGILIKYVLVSGVKRNIVYGKHIDLNFMGLDRHQWGDIHFIISLIFLLLLVVHISLHWIMIKNIFQRIIPNKIVRYTTGSIFGITCLTMLVFSIGVSPELTARYPTYRNEKIFTDQQNIADPIDRKQTQLLTTNQTDSPENENCKEEILNKTTFNFQQINGSQSLSSVAKTYHISIEELASELNIPISLKEEKIGRLKKQYSFTMNDIRMAVKTLSKNKK